MSEVLYLHDIEIKREPSNPKFDFPDRSNLRLYCADKEGKPTYVEVKGFKPHFYLEAVEGGPTLKDMKRQFAQEFWHSNVKKAEIVKRQRLLGFANHTKFEYLKLEFSGVIPMFCGRKKIREGGAQCKMYEDKVDPVLVDFTNISDEASRSIQDSLVAAYMYSDDRMSRGATPISMFSN